ncbi:FirrV-1-A44 precursor [Feldmannia irregularis virus a]|uniref:FirrV-1-A44 n=1 Tax=Feldmannia irregularis virus a TaxID=231992 RepID=Q6XM43_9PHYC|nr:FirrV-1-A44 precursor [Feldmannia irregularis virus a]AAR26868.1 FirrV-1-A44 precursor [Feldmannia irregularis virus a]
MESALMKGCFKGGLYGLCGGIFLGAAGALTPSQTPEQLVWTTHQGKKVRLVYLHHVPGLKDHLTVIFQHRTRNERAFNEAFRNIQNVLSVYHLSSSSRTPDNDPPDIMAATKMTNYTVRASKAMEAVHVSILQSDFTKAAAFEEAMMKIQLTLEEKINEIRLKSKQSLPTIVPRTPGEK